MNFSKILDLELFTKFKNISNKNNKKEIFKKVKIF